MLSHSSSMAVRSCWISAGTGTLCRIYVDPEHPKHAQLVTCLVSMQAMEELYHFQELCTDPCDMGPCIIMLKHEVMAADEWHDNESQDLFTVSLCNQIAIDKMQFCLLFVAYTCPYHNPTATMGHSVHNIDICKPFAHTTPSAICPVQLKLGFIREEHTSPACQWPSKVSICPLKLVMMPNCCQVKTLVRTTSMKISFPETV